MNSTAVKDRNNKMRILVDIGHPAHVHFYRNFISRINSGNEVYVTARDKEVTFSLLNNYGISYLSRGGGGRTLFEKFTYLFKAVRFILSIVRKNNIDLLTGINNPYVSIAGFLCGKPSVVFNDTEHARLTSNIVKLFSSAMLTPNCYHRNEGKKQFRYDGFHELAYLHPDHFKPDPSICDVLGLVKDEEYIILRFVSWEASHDVGHRGLSIEMKRKLVKELSKYGRVFISSEGELPEDLKQYQIKIPPEKMHDVLAFSNLYIGESPTMTTESALLGTPAICVSSWACDCGNFVDLKRYKLIECYKPEDEEVALERAIGILRDKRSKSLWRLGKEELLKDKIDVTAFMLWFVENYPESFWAMRKGKGTY